MYTRTRLGTIASVVAGTLLLSACGGGEKAIIGVGNSGNRMGGLSETAEELGEELAATGAIPRVSDETLREIYGVVLQKALDGDLPSALTIVELAADQREAEE